MGDLSGGLRYSAFEKPRPGVSNRTFAIITDQDGLAPPRKGRRYRLCEKVVSYVCSEGQSIKQRLNPERLCLFKKVYIIQTEIPFIQVIYLL